MKKLFVILILLILFIICAAMGFSGAKSAWQSISGVIATPVNPTANSVAAGIQHNLVVIRVDDLQSHDPVLISTWILFTTFSDPPYLVMKILFPGSKITSLKNNFYLDPEGRLAPQFEEEIQKLNFPWDGYLLIDNQGIQKLSEWLLDQPVEFLPYDPQSSPDGFTVFLDDSRRLSSFCESLSDVQQESTFPFWREIIPSHMRSNLGFDDLVLYWDYMTRSTNPPYCEIIPWE